MDQLVSYLLCSDNVESDMRNLRILRPKVSENEEAFVFNLNVDSEKVVKIHILYSVRPTEAYIHHIILITQINFNHF